MMLTGLSGLESERTLRKLYKSQRELMISSLKSLRADGLCNSNGQCGCGIEDLAPADCLELDLCVAAKFIRPDRGSPEFWDEFPDGYYTPLKIEPTEKPTLGMISCGHMRLSPEAARLGKKAIFCVCPGAEGLCEVNWRAGCCPCEEEIIS